MVKTLYKALAEECERQIQKALPIDILAEDELLEIQEIVLRQAGLFEACRKISKSGPVTLLRVNRSFSAIHYALSTGLLDNPIPEEVLSRSHNHYNGIGHLRELTKIEMDEPLWSLVQGENLTFRLYYLDREEDSLKDETF